MKKYLALWIFSNLFYFLFAGNTFANREFDYTLHNVVLECDRGAVSGYVSEDKPMTASFWGLSNNIHFTAFRTFRKSGKNSNIVTEFTIPAKSRAASTPEFPPPITATSLPL